MGNEIYEIRMLVSPTDVNEHNRFTNQALLRFLQNASSAHCSSFGYGVDSINTTHLAWIILNWKVKIYTRPNCGETIIIKTWCNPLEKIYFHRDFEILDSNGNLVAIATSRWILKNILTNTICHNLNTIKKQHPFFSKSVFKEPFKHKLMSPESATSSINYVVPRRDIDTNHHVNNVHYLDYAYEALPHDVYCNLEFNNIEIMYKNEAKFGDLLTLSYIHTDDNKHIVAITSPDLLHCIVHLYN